MWENDMKFEFEWKRWNLERELKMSNVVSVYEDKQVESEQKCVSLFLIETVFSEKYFWGTLV
jgi:hypothetical protein